MVFIVKLFRLEEYSQYSRHICLFFFVFFTNFTRVLPLKKNVLFISGHVGKGFKEGSFINLSSLNQMLVIQGMCVNEHGFR